MFLNSIICIESGTYERSCFGSSIEALVYISVPVREIPVGRLMELVRTNFAGTMNVSFLSLNPLRAVFNI